MILPRRERSFMKLFKDFVDTIRVVPSVYLYRKHIKLIDFIEKRV